MRRNTGWRCRRFRQSAESFLVSKRAFAEDRGRARDCRQLSVAALELDIAELIANIHTGANQPLKGEYLQRL